MALSDSVLVTREAWHRLAEHVLSAARHAATGRIGLLPAPGGFATPEFGSLGLAAFAAVVPEDEPTSAQLWPEHFDLGITAARVNYGVSPGDTGRQAVSRALNRHSEPERCSSTTSPTG